MICCGIWGESSVGLTQAGRSRTHKPSQDVAQPREDISAVITLYNGERNVNDITRLTGVQQRTVQRFIAQFKDNFVQTRDQGVAGYYSSILLQ